MVRKRRAGAPRENVKRQGKRLMKWVWTSIGAAIMAVILAPVVNAENNAAAQEAAAAAYPGIDEAYYEQLVKLEDRHPRLFKLWRDVVTMQEKRYEMQSAFGSNKRAAAARLIPRISRKLQGDQEEFKDDFFAVRAEYEQTLDQLKQKEMTLGVAIGFEDGSSPGNDRDRQRLDELMAEMTRLDAAISALDQLLVRVKQTNRNFNEAEFFGFLVREWKRLCKDFPDAVETRREVQDYMADLQEVKKLKGTSEWDIRAERREAYLEQGLSRSIEKLQTLAARGKTPFQRNAERLRRQIERLDERIARTDKPDRYQKERDELQKELDKEDESIALFDKLADVKPADE